MTGSEFTARLQVELNYHKERLQAVENDIQYSTRDWKRDDKHIAFLRKELMFKKKMREAVELAIHRERVLCRQKAKEGQPYGQHMRNIHKFRNRLKFEGSLVSRVVDQLTHYGKLKSRRSSLAYKVEILKVERDKLTRVIGDLETKIETLKMTNCADFKKAMLGAASKVSAFAPVPEGVNENSGEIKENKDA